MTALARPAANATISVWVVDDDESVCGLLESILTSVGANVTVSSGAFETYHVINPYDDGISMDTFVDWLVEAGRSIVRVPDYARHRDLLRDDPVTETVSLAPRDVRILEIDRLFPRGDPLP